MKPAGRLPRLFQLFQMAGGISLHICPPYADHHI